MSEELTRELYEKLRAVSEYTMLAGLKEIRDSAGRIDDDQLIARINGLIGIVEQMVILREETE